MGKKKGKIDVGGEGESMGHNPFGSVDFSNIELNTNVVPSKGGGKVKDEVKRSRGRVDVKRVKGGRGGKEVTLVEGLPGSDVEGIMKDMKRKLGCGGAVKEGVLELQGDKRQEVQVHLEGMGFRVVFAGG